MEMIVKFHIINQSKMGHLWWHAYHWDSFMGVSHLVPSSPTPPRSWLVFEDSQFVDKIQPPKGWPGLLKPSTSTGSWASGTTKSALRWIPTIYIYYNILYYIYMRYSYEPYNIYIYTHHQHQCWIPWNMRCVLISLPLCVAEAMSWYNNHHVSWWKPPSYHQGNLLQLAEEIHSPTYACWNLWDCLMIYLKSTGEPSNFHFSLQ